jgi:chromosome segregation ATPase
VLPPDSSRGELKARSVGISGGLSGAAICTAIGGLVGGAATAFVMIRKANAEVEMGERKQEDGVAAEAYALFKEAMTSRVTALEKIVDTLMDKLEKAREAHAKCEVETANLKGDMRVMQLKIDRLTKHEQNNEDHLKGLTKAVVDIDPTAAAKLP